MGLLRMILRKYGREPKIENFGASNEIHACSYLFVGVHGRYVSCIIDMKTPSDRYILFVQTDSKQLNNETKRELVLDQ
jgi:hypothetical protein